MNVLQWNGMYSADLQGKSGVLRSEGYVSRRTAP